MRTSALQIILILFVGAFTGTAGVRGQETTPAGDPDHEVTGDSTVVEVVLADGSTLTGRILGEEDGIIQLELLTGDVIQLRRARLQDIRTFEGRVVRGKVWRPDPNATRLFFAPTGRSLGQGQGYLSVYEVIMPFLAVGVTDRVALSGGTPLVFSADSERVFWFAPKLQVLRGSRFSAAIGALHFLSTAAGSEGVGVAYGVATFGTRDDALTVGAGYGYSGSDFAAEPVLMVGGEARGSRSVKLISENYLLPSGTLLLSGGFRFFGERLTADLGLVMPTDGTDAAVFPLVNFVYNW